MKALDACPELALLDSAVSARIEMLTEAYDDHIASIPLASVSERVLAAVERISAPDLAVPLQHLKGFQLPIAKALEACGPEPKRTLSHDSTQAARRAIALLLVLTSGTFDGQTE